MDLDQAAIVAAERRRLARELTTAVWEAIAPHVTPLPVRDATALQLPGSLLAVPLDDGGPAAAQTVRGTTVTVRELEALLAAPVLAALTWVDATGEVAGAVQGEGRGALVVLRALAGFVASGWPPPAAAHAAPETLPRPVRVSPPVSDTALVEWRHFGDDLRLHGELTVRPPAGTGWRSATRRALRRRPRVDEEALATAYAAHRGPDGTSAAWDSAAGPYDLSVSVAPC